MMLIVVITDTWIKWKRMSGITTLVNMAASLQPTSNYHIFEYSEHKITYMWPITVIDFSSGPVAHGQWKLIQTSDFCQIFSIESI